MKILFMCVANSARSQIAEALAQRMFPNAEIQSAGSHPGTLNPCAVKVLQEFGMDISGRSSKAVEDLPQDFVAALDYVITLCAEEVCPTIVSTARRLHWPMPDPATMDPLPEGEMMGRFRTARDAIHEKLKKWKQELAL